MPISNTIQISVAAFSFGILLEAASGGIFIYYKGHGSTILQDGRRLVLVLFLLFAALWAQIDFVNLMLPTASPSACQGMLILSTIFDQLARVAIAQFLLWSVGHGTKLSAERLILQGILVVRLVAGGIYVGYSRPEFAPTCIARTSLLPTSIVVLALDAIIIGVLIIRAFSLGMFSDLLDKRSNARQEQSRALILSVAGFMVWTGASVAMVLGIPEMLLILRTTLPSNGLLILVGLVTIFSGALLSPREGEMTTPEAQSPFVASATLPREIFRGNHGNGSPKSGNIYAKSGRLFVVNQTPRESPTHFQTNRQSDTRGFRKLDGETTEQNLERDEQVQAQSSSKNGPGNRRSSGVFGSIVAAPMIGGNQRAQAPQIRPPPSHSTRESSVPVFPPSSIQQKRSLFSWSKPPAKTPIRSLGISKPVMADTEGADARPFARIPTIDLATAAINEKERREGAAAKARPLTNKPMPPRPSVSAQEGLRKSISTKRKEMPIQSRDILPTVPGSTTSSLLAAGTHASSTSASLSPGREEVRRRSPRSVSSFDIMIDEKPMPEAELQRRPTIGLPSNPRSQRAVMTREHVMPREQTVMYLNNIVYENPGMVKTIIHDAAESYQASQRPKTADESSIVSYTTTLMPSNSIIHRPRPYRKYSEKERGLFPSEPSLHHKRSKSGSAIMSRSSMFSSHPGSPTQLPPLPPMPKTASELRRLLPNNTKSMTFDEKIQLLFPAPPRSTLIHNRRSSVPSLPRAPSVFMSDSPPTRSPTDEEHQSRRTSKRTTIASFVVTADSNVRANSPKHDVGEDEQEQTFHFSSHAYRNVADDLGRSWLPGIPMEEDDNRNVVQEEPNREPVHDKRKSSISESTSSDESYQDDSTTYWGSVHSKIPHVDIKKARRNARSTFIHQGNSTGKPETSASLSTLTYIGQNDHEETIPILLDTDEANSSTSSLSDSNRSSLSLDVDEALPGNKVPSPRNVPAWHRRIGDQLPTFSERESKARLRKMPPPTPLLLNRMSRNATIVVHAAEPSPVESPKKAIEEIQAQLKRFEEPDRESFGSIIRHIPGNTSKQEDYTQVQIEDRLRLLENLEKEMGQQEDQWQQMQTNLDRDSISTTSTAQSPPPPPPKDASFSRGATQRDSRRLSRGLSQRARVRSSMTLRSKGEDSTCTTSTQSSDNSRASVWQQRLAEAQLEYLENAPTLLRKSLNFLSMSNIQLGSPTPPDSLDSGTDIETELESDSDNSRTDVSRMSEASHGKLPALWQPAPPSPKAATGRLWNHPYETSSSRTTSPEPPAKIIRPSQHRILQPLQITSFSLWSKPHSPESRRSAFGLWRSKLIRPKSIVTRRASQKPIRKTRRVTCLPDIVESPLPVPHKRDTLGIFQFPWGETSDQPVYQPAFVPTLVSNSTMNSKFDARSLQIEPELAEYSSSFFDDYDDEEEGDDEANYEDSEDDFDETTLLEIADLLQSTDVPSRQSLLFSPRDIIEDYDGETDPESSSEVDDTAAKATLAPIRLPIPPLAMTPRMEPRFGSSDDGHESLELTDCPPQLESAIQITISSASVTKSAMWTQQPDKVDSRKPGLFSVDDKRPIIHRTEETPAAIRLLRAPRTSNTTLPLISSQNLWSFDKSTPEEIHWLSISPVEYSRPVTIPSRHMWTAAPRKSVESVTGLFDVSNPASDYRTTDSEPAALRISRKPRVIQSPLSQLESNTLWNGLETLHSEHHWISESSVRPASPSVYSSTTSSGRTSPSSDMSSEDTSDNASVNTTSTKASSFWGSVGSTARAAIPAWWESSSSKKIPSPSPIEDPEQAAKSSPSAATTEEVKVNSKIPMLRRQKSREAPATVRESRVLVTRDLWEAKALEQGNTLVQNSHTSMVTEIPDVPSQKRLGDQHRPIVASKADWSAALAVAIVAGCPQEKPADPIVSKSRSRIQRIIATSEMWEAALMEAIAKSRSTSTVRTSPQNSYLWSLSSGAITSKRNLLWSKDAVLETAVIPQAVCIRSPAHRRVLSAENPELSRIESTKLWEPNQPVSCEHNWLSAPISSLSPQTWMLRRALTTTQTDKNPRMWSPPNNTLSDVSPDLFIHMQAGHIKKSTPPHPAALQRLNSSELFTPTTSYDDATHWLHSTSFSFVSSPIEQPAPMVPTKSLTWTVPSIKSPTNQEHNGLWKSCSKSPSNSYTRSSVVYTEPWSRKKRTSDGKCGIEPIKSSSLWRPFRETPASPKNWLVQKKASKVQFRY